MTNTPHPVYITASPEDKPQIIRRVHTVFMDVFMLPSNVSIMNAVEAGYNQTTFGARPRVLISTVACLHQMLPFTLSGKVAQW